MTNSLIGIVGGREVYLVSCPAFADDKECVFYLRRKRPDVKRPIFLFYRNV